MDGQSYRIVEAQAEHDRGILRLAASSGLKVRPDRERDREITQLLVAVEDDRVIGFVVAWLVADELEISDVCVDTDHRRSGIGRALIERLFAGAAARGASNAFLEVRVSNAPARRLYEAMGFSEVGRRKAYYSDGEDALLFRCCVGRAR